MTKKEISMSEYPFLKEDRDTFSKIAMKEMAPAAVKLFPNSNGLVIKIHLAYRANLVAVVAFAEVINSDDPSPKLLGTFIFKKLDNYMLASTVDRVSEFPEIDFNKIFEQSLAQIQDTVILFDQATQVIQLVDEADYIELKDSMRSSFKSLSKLRDYAEPESISIYGKLTEQITGDFAFYGYYKFLKNIRLNKFKVSGLQSGMYEVMFGNEYCTLFFWEHEPSSNIEDRENNGIIVLDSDAEAFAYGEECLKTKPRLKCL